MAILSPKMTRCCNFRSALRLRICFQKVAHKKGQELDQNYTNGFSEKNIL